MSKLSASNATYIAIVAAVVIGSFLLLVSFSLPQGDSTYAAFQNFGHFMLFAALGLIVPATLLHLFTDRLSLMLAVSALVLVVLGVGVELYQIGMPDRSASVSDFVLDIAGMIAGFLMFLFYCLLKQGRKQLVLLAGCGFLLVTAVAIKPLIPLVGFDLLRPDLPLIRSFDHRFAEQKIEAVGGALYKRVSVQGEEGQDSTCCALRITFSPARYSGIIFEENAPTRSGTWGAYSALNIKVFSSLRTNRQIALRINDRLHNNQYSDRYNTPLSIRPGLNELSIPISLIASMGRTEPKPAGREMDIDDITRIQLYAADVGKQFTLDVLSIGLE